MPETNYHQLSRTTCLMCEVPLTSTKVYCPKCHIETLQWSAKRASSEGGHVTAANLAWAADEISRLQSRVAELEQACELALKVFGSEKLDPDNLIDQDVVGFEAILFITAALHPKPHPAKEPTT